jgi:hypothetical protein
MAEKQPKLDVGIGLPTHDGTYTWETTRCLERMALYCNQKGISIQPLRQRKQPIHCARNNMARAALEFEAEFLLFVDSDMHFEADALGRLMAHDVGVVGGLSVKTIAPYWVNASIWDDENPKPIQDWEEGALIDYCDGAGAGFMLIKTSIFRALSQPYFYPFQNKHGLDMGEDYYFCKKVREELREKIYVDTSLWIGHVAPVVFTPKNFLHYRDTSAARDAEERKLSAIEGQNMDLINRKLDEALK